MQEFARSKGMEVIPLVQTFGHMEVRPTPYNCPIFGWSSVSHVSEICMPCFYPVSVTVRAKASAHVAPERGGAVRRHPESPQRGRREAGDGDAEASGGAAPRSEHTAHRSRRGRDGPFG